MTLDQLDQHDALLFGANRDSGLVGIELKEKKGGDTVVLFFRRDGEISQETEKFRPFILAAEYAIADCPVAFELSGLTGRARLNSLAVFKTWKDCIKARSWLTQDTGFSASAPGAPYYCINDPIQQHLMLSGRTLFKGMEFEDLRRMQVDIECRVSAGYEFCSAEREGDEIIMISMSDQSGWTQVLAGHRMSEKEMLSVFVATVCERDPDVLEGHNIFNFDLPYIKARARMHGVKLTIGRDGSVPRWRQSRLSIGERTLTYQRCDVFGRHIIDTLFLVHAYDISHRSLDGFGLKAVARHFGLASKDRTYIEGDEIAATFDADPDRVEAYALDDVRETRSVSDLLSRTIFAQAQMLPYSYQSVSVRGNATKIDSLMVREYLRQEHSLPAPVRGREFAGGYTDMFVEGVVENVHHCDVRSLYPSLMLTRQLGPEKDTLGAFLKMLSVLRRFRIHAKEQMGACSSVSERHRLDVLQSTFKVLINSFYGYLGFGQAHFSDFDAAESVTAEGRALLRSMIEWLQEHGARPIEIDTDGIYYVPPSGGAADEKRFREGFAAFLPEGIEVEFDGEFEAMYSYKMKNYALLAHDGEITIKGAALKSRGLAPFQRSFLKDVIRLKLTKSDAEIPGMKQNYERAIREREWPIKELAKTETLQDSPATYATKRGKGGRSKSAVYELALASGRDYRAGDQISYYVTGEKKSVAVHESAKLVSAWDSEKRDENVAYYLAKLEAMYTKFCEVDTQGELQLG